MSGRWWDTWRESGLEGEGRDEFNFSYWIEDTCETEHVSETVQHVFGSQKTRITKQRITEQFWELSWGKNDTLIDKWYLYTEVYNFFYYHSTNRRKLWIPSGLRFCQADEIKIQQWTKQIKLIPSLTLVEWTNKHQEVVSSMKKMN